MSFFSIPIPLFRKKTSIISFLCNKCVVFPVVRSAFGTTSFTFGQAVDPKNTPDNAETTEVKKEPLFSFPGKIFSSSFPSSYLKTITDSYFYIVKKMHT